MVKKDLEHWKSHFRIEKAATEDYPEIMRIWESSVKATHHFLKPEDFEFYKHIAPTDLLPELDLYILQCDEMTIGFIGVANTHLETLFVEANSIGKGYGKVLLNFAIKNLGVTTVDVNEQNKNALAFYKNAGFRIIGRSDKDAMGKDYPILHLEVTR